MSIKARIILGFFLTILLTASGGIFFASMQMRDDADSEFAQSSGRQLTLLNDYLENFLRTAQTNASLVASMEQFTALAGSMPNFTAATQDSDYTSVAISPEVRAALVPLRSMNSKNADYLEVYVGYPNGAYATGLAEMRVPAVSIPASGRGIRPRRLPPRTACCPRPMCRSPGTSSLP